MKFIVPVAVTPAMLSIGFSEPSSTETEWELGKAYAVGAYCIMLETHKIYQCLIAIDIDTNFPPNTNLISAANLAPKWREISSTNAWKMFDSYGSTQTIGSISDYVNLVQIGPTSGFNSLALISIANIQSIEISCLNSLGASVYYATFNTSGKSDYVVNDIICPVGGSMDLYLYTQRNASGTPVAVPRIGKLEIGNYFELGDINYGSSVGIIDYSTKNTDLWGNTTIVKRAYTKRITAKLTILNSKIDSVANKLAAYRSTPVVWIGNENLYTSLIVYGFYRDFDINIAYPMQSDCSLTIEGIN